MVLARRQHLVACIRPPERVHVPFPWHTAPYPPSSASLHLFRVLSARVPFQDCSRAREYLYQYLVATRLVYTYVKESNDSKKKKNRRLLFHRGTTRITYHIAVYFPLFFPSQEVVEGNKAGSRFPACRGRTQERPRATFCDRILGGSRRDPRAAQCPVSCRGLYSRPGYPPAVLDVHLLFAEVSHSPLRSGIVHTRTCADCVRVNARAQPCRSRASARILHLTRTLSTPLHPCGQTSLRASRTGVSRVCM